MKKLKEKKTLLAAALKDINFDIRTLQRDRRQLEFTLRDTSQNIDMTRTKEASLRNKLSNMITKESSLSDKKEKVKQDLAKLKQKIDKVSKIRRDLKEV
ncbi:MAG: hypothetical protein ABIB47_02610 [Candidatus Woesearchaeota archaeon]